MTRGILRAKNPFPIPHARVIHRPRVICWHVDLSSPRPVGVVRIDQATITVVHHPGIRTIDGQPSRSRGRFF